MLLEDTFTQEQSGNHSSVNCIIATLIKKKKKVFTDPTYGPKHFKSTDWLVDESSGLLLLVCRWFADCLWICLSFVIRTLHWRCKAENKWGSSISYTWLCVLTRFAGDSHGTPRPRSAVRFVRQRRWSGRLPREVAACLTSTFLRIFMNFLYAFTLESE